MNQSNQRESGSFVAKFLKKRQNLWPQENRNDANSVPGLKWMPVKRDMLFVAALSPESEILEQSGEPQIKKVEKVKLKKLNLKNMFSSCNSCNYGPEKRPSSQQQQAKSKRVAFPVMNLKHLSKKEHVADPNVEKFIRKIQQRERISNIQNEEQIQKENNRNQQQLSQDNQSAKLGSKQPLANKDFEKFEESKEEKHHEIDIEQIEKAHDIMKEGESNLSEYDFCSFCNSHIAQGDVVGHTVIQSTDCFHGVHESCLVKAIKSKRANDGFLNCPTCKKQIADAELKSHVSEDEWTLIEQTYVMNLIKEQGLFQCDCGNVIDIVPGEITYGQKDDQGKLLSAEAAEHMALYRVRCNQCSKNWCTNCRAQPYHLGKTCEQNVGRECRFCLGELKEQNSKNGPAFVNVCKAAECQALIKASCDKVLECGHPCGGIRGEAKCLPCLEPDCIAKQADQIGAPTQDKDDYCAICYTSGLGQEPSVRLDCKHVVHHSCVKQQVSGGWNGARIVFNYLDCPLCKRGISCPTSPELTKVLNEQLKFKQQVEQKAQKRATYDNLHKDEKFVAPGNPYGNDLLAFAMSTLSYYQCYQCKDAYFVGRKDCAEGAQLDVNNLDKEALFCPKCMPVALGGGETNCKVHGSDYIEYKCKFCCRRAIWFCWGNTHFCDPCHRQAYSVNKRPVSELPKCPGASCDIKMAHPGPGVEFALGCGLCAEQQFKKKNENILDF